VRHVVQHLDAGRVWHDISAPELTVAVVLEQIFELIALVGFYHTVSFFANGLRLGAEPYAVPPPA
jgi:hypothetical protein